MSKVKQAPLAVTIYRRAKFVDGAESEGDLLGAVVVPAHAGISELIILKYFKEENPFGVARIQSHALVLRVETSADKLLESKLPLSNALNLRLKAPFLEDRLGFERGMMRIVLPEYKDWSFCQSRPNYAATQIEHLLDHLRGDKPLISEAQQEVAQEQKQRLDFWGIF